MPTTVTLTGVSEAFDAEQIEDLVRAAGESVFGQFADLTHHQVELAGRAYNLDHPDLNHPDAVPPGPAVTRLVALALRLTVGPADLSGIVQDLARKPPRVINAGGLRSQIAYLVGHLGEPRTRQVIQDAAPASTTTNTAIPATLTITVATLYLSDDHGATLTVHASEQAARDALHENVTRAWDDMFCLDGAECGVPECHGQPATVGVLTREQAIDAYYAHHPHSHDYDLVEHELEIPRPTPASRT